MGVLAHFESFFHAHRAEGEMGMGKWPKCARTPILPFLNGTGYKDKENIIHLLQESNKELEDYAANLQKFCDIQAAYKRKPISSSQNKGRTMKCFLSRAETALWFSQYFGLEVDSILVNKNDTNVAHTLKINSEASCGEVLPLVMVFLNHT